MELQIIEFLNDKVAFLEKFSRGGVLIQPLLIGFIFSFAQKELKDRIELFRALRRIKYEVDDLYQVAYAVVKTLKSAEVYMEQFESNEFLVEYCEITTGLASMKFPKILEGKVAIMFCSNWNRLAQIYVKSENFVKVYRLGKNNIRLFTRVPIILSADLEEDVSSIIRFLDEGEDSEIPLNISNLLRFLRFDSANTSDQKVLSDFLVTSIKILFRISPKLEVIQEINKKIEENNHFFDEQSRIELKNDYSCRLKSIFSLIQNPKAVHQPVSGSLNKVKVELSQYEKKDVVEFYSNKVMIKIPKKDYTEKSVHVGYSANPKPLPNQLKQQDKEAYFNKSDEAPKEIVLENQDFEQNLKDLIQNCLSESKTQEIDKTVILSMFKSYEQEVVTFSNHLHKILNETINKSYSDDNFEFWDMIMDVSKSFLKNNEVGELIDIINAKNLEKSQKEQVRRGNSRISHSPRAREQEYLPNNSKNVRGANASWQVQEEKLQKNLNIQEDLQKNLNIQEKPLKNPEVEEKAHNSSLEEAKNASDLGLCCGYYKILNHQCRDLIEGIRSQTAELAKINEPIQRIKDLLKEKSPGSKFNLIGSAHSGTHLKGTQVDLNYIDFLNPDPCSFLKSVIMQVDLPVITEYPNNITFAYGEISYSVHINLDYYYETSLLVKTYCGLDSRCRDLVTLAKCWAHKHEVYNGLMSGFHLTLLCITFLQMCQPPILPLLQQGDHIPEVSVEVDVWFERNSEFFSTNTSTLGEIIAFFFQFLISLADNYTCFPSTGQVVLNPSHVLLSCCSLFGNTEVSSVFKVSDSTSVLRKSLNETVENLSAQSDLYKIMRIRQ